MYVHLSGDRAGRAAKWPIVNLRKKQHYIMYNLGSKVDLSTIINGW